MLVLIAVVALDLSAGEVVAIRPVTRARAAARAMQAAASDQWPVRIPERLKMSLIAGSTTM
jgi:hypothetical protein